MGQIRMTPEELRGGAGNIKGIASEVQGQLEALRSKVDEVCSNWEGAAQASFTADFDEIYKIFKEQFPPAIEGIATKLEAAAQAVEDTDAELAKVLGGK